MALVAYSDSEGSDVEADTPAAPSTVTSKKSDSGAGFHIDRSNPRKIRVALPELKPEHPTNEQNEDGPSRKKPRLGGGGGAFSGFNALLPAPKRAADKKPPATTRKVFSLKTGAAPGFDRESDAEMRHEQVLDGDEVTATIPGVDETIPKAGSLGQSTGKSNGAPVTKTESGEVKLQGNPMMFRPLSVGRPQKKKKITKPPGQPTPGSATTTESTVQQPPTATPEPTTALHPPKSKPKVNLFSLSSEDSTRTDNVPTLAGAYEPLVYNTEMNAPSAGPVPESTPVSNPARTEYTTTATVSSQPNTLDNIANDLNLSKSERRQLFGRHALPGESRILEFNTDQEYASNQALAQGELAAAQHNPVRAIAPGKHSLQQLVNAATSQKEALEESFAAGRRNKKEAGSKYGW